MKMYFWPVQQKAKIKRKSKKNKKKKYRKIVTDRREKNDYLFSLIGLRLLLLSSYSSFSLYLGNNRQLSVWYAMMTMIRFVIMSLAYIKLVVSFTEFSLRCVHYPKNSPTNREFLSVCTQADEMRLIQLTFWFVERKKSKKREINLMFSSFFWQHYLKGTPTRLHHFPIS